MKGYPGVGQLMVSPLGISERSPNLFHYPTALFQRRISHEEKSGQKPRSSKILTATLA